MWTAVRVVLKLSEHVSLLGRGRRAHHADQELASDNPLVAWPLTHADRTTIPTAELMADGIIKEHSSGPDTGLSVDNRISATVIQKLQVVR